MDQVGNPGRVRIGRDHRQIGRGEGEIDQHHVGVFGERARKRDRGKGRTDAAFDADHGDAAAGFARLPQFVRDLREAAGPVMRRRRTAAARGTAPARLPA